MSWSTWDSRGKANALQSISLVLGCFLLNYPLGIFTRKVSRNLGHESVQTTSLEDDPLLFSIRLAMLTYSGIACLVHRTTIYVTLRTTACHSPIVVSAHFSTTLEQTRREILPIQLWYDCKISDLTFWSIQRIWVPVSFQLTNLCNLLTKDPC